MFETGEYARNAQNSDALILNLRPQNYGLFIRADEIAALRLR